MLKKDKTIKKKKKQNKKTKKDKKTKQKDNSKLEIKKFFFIFIKKLNLIAFKEF
jgi:hypothetical protein